MALIQNLMTDKGFHLEDLDVKEFDGRGVKISKTVKNGDGDDVPMSILISFNLWGRKLEFPFLKQDDCYIYLIENGTQEQSQSGKGVAPEGIFTEFVKQVVGNNKFYVKRAEQFWYDTFTCVNVGSGIISCIDHSTVGDTAGVGATPVFDYSKENRNHAFRARISEGGGRRKKTRRRKYKKKSKKRRKSKRKSKRKPKRRCRSSRTRRRSR